MKSAASAESPAALIHPRCGHSGLQVATMILPATGGGRDLRIPAIDVIPGELAVLEQVPSSASGALLRRLAGADRARASGIRWQERPTWQLSSAERQRFFPQVRPPPRAAADETGAELLGRIDAEILLGLHGCPSCARERSVCASRRLAQDLAHWWSGPCLRPAFFLIGLPMSDGEQRTCLIEAARRIADLGAAVVVSVGEGGVEWLGGLPGRHFRCRPAEPVPD